MPSVHTVIKEWFQITTILKTENILHWQEKLQTYRNEEGILCSISSIIHKGYKLFKTNECFQESPLMSFIKIWK